jgi:hypothetical protein
MILLASPRLVSAELQWEALQGRSFRFLEDTRDENADGACDFD